MSKPPVQIEQVSPATQISKEKRWFSFLFSPLWLCLLVAIASRIWLTIHTGGVIAGDEGLVGIQAEHILQGERPIYYYGQPYMGSLEMYIMALIFAITGPSVWALRATTALISLILVLFTWSFSTSLADAAQLSPRAKTIFMTIASLVAALPPLYSLMVELRAWGGYIEAFVAMLWLLFSAYWLTQRWQAGATYREIAMRWAGLGFILGLGFWIDPLIIYAIATVALWIGGSCLWLLIKPTVLNPRRNTFKNLSLVIIALPTTLLGSAPAIYWGAHNNWENITYLFKNGGNVSTTQEHLYIIQQVAGVYTTCLAPRVIGGTLSTEPNVTLEHPQVVTFGLIISTICIFIALVCIALSFTWPQTIIVRIRRLTALPVLFACCASAIFCTSSISVGIIASGCGPQDLAGRYVVPLVIILPFFIATIFTLPWMHTPEKVEFDTQQGKHPLRSHTVLVLVRLALLIVLCTYFFTQIRAYVQSNAGYTFQTSGCVMAPANNDPVIAYMQQQHIRYALATGWIADPITFKTNSSIIVTEEHGRLQANDVAVLHSDRPSILLLQKRNSRKPQLLQHLDKAHITYHVGRFPSASDFDILVITPISQTVLPSNPAFHKDFQTTFEHC